MRRLTDRNLSLVGSLALAYRMNTIRMETFANRLGQDFQICNDIAVDNHGAEARIWSGSAPDVEFVNG